MNIFVGIHLADCIVNHEKKPGNTKGLQFAEINPVSLVHFQLTNIKEDLYNSPDVVPPFRIANSLVLLLALEASKIK